MELTLLISVDNAVMIAHESVMGNMGQNCCAGSRTFVQDKIYDEFVKKSIEAANNRPIGDPMNPVNVNGPQVSCRL